MTFIFSFRELNNKENTAVMKNAKQKLVSQISNMKTPSQSLAFFNSMFYLNLASSCICCFVPLLIIMLIRQRFYHTMVQIWLANIGRTYIAYNNTNEDKCGIYCAVNNADILVIITESVWKNEFHKSKTHPG